MAKNRYRDRLDIIADILSVTGEAARKTRIMYGANLSFELVNRYLGEVLKAELVFVNPLGGALSYTLTEKGREFLKHYDEYRALRRRAEEHSSSIGAVRVELERLSTVGG